MKHTLVGYTGFVGGNLLAAHAFDGLYNSANITDSFGAGNGLVVYSGMASEKFLADADPAADLAKAEEARQNIRRMQPEKLVLISTVDVYPSPVGVDESAPAGGEGSLPYGANRHQLEAWVREDYPDALIVRLPALFGRRLKKNFIYDMLTLVPSMLRQDKYEELAAKQPLITAHYHLGEGGFYRLGAVESDQRAALKTFFANNDFNSLQFTDSRSVFQFYDLSRLWQDIEAALAARLSLINMAVQPMPAGEVYKAVFKKEFTNHLAKPPFNYDMRTRHAEALGGANGYLADKEEVAAALCRFAKTFQP